jgi:hypothetical protein
MSVGRSVGRSRRTKSPRSLCQFHPNKNIFKEDGNLFLDGVAVDHQSYWTHSEAPCSTRIYVRSGNDPLV